MSSQVIIMRICDGMVLLITVQNDDVDDARHQGSLVMPISHVINDGLRRHFSSIFSNSLMTPTFPHGQCTFAKSSTIDIYCITHQSLILVRRYWVSVLCSWDLKSDHSKTELFEDQISNGPVFKGSGYSPNHLKSGPFQMVFDKMVVICQDFKWFCFQTSNPIL